MTPGQRDALAVAKRIAQPCANAVRNRSEHHYGLLTAGLSRDELLALLAVAFEASDLDLLKLVCEADDGGTVPKQAKREERHVA